jgi:hypothetical protein
MHQVSSLVCPGYQPRATGLVIIASLMVASDWSSFPCTSLMKSFLLAHYLSISISLRVLNLIEVGYLQLYLPTILHFSSLSYLVI